MSEHFPKHDIGAARASVRHSSVRHGVLRFTFADGLAGEIGVLNRMCGPVFDDARPREGIATVRVEDETGTLVWPGGADLAPDTLYERVRTGVWPDQVD